MNARYNTAMKKKITHLDRSGKARMIDVSQKPHNERWAKARGTVAMSTETLALVRSGDLKKGDVRAAAELAGVMAAKRTSDLIPLCHPLMLSHVEVEIELSETLPGAIVTALVRTQGPTGVEMEALTAVAIAALTVYDMIKAVEPGARIMDVRLLEKHGGQSGDLVLES